MGSDQAKELTGDNWWERVFNEAANNLDIVKESDGKVKVLQKDADSVEITNKSYSLKKLKDKSASTTYGNFLKAATLHANIGKETEIVGHVKTEDIELTPAKQLTDEELFNVS